VQVAEGIHRLTQGVVNFYLIDDGGRLTVVDAGAPADFDLFARSVAALGRSITDVDAVLITHAHSDHAGFAERARTTAHAPVWVHAADAESLRTGKAGKNDGSATAYLAKPAFYKTAFSLVRRGAGKIVPVAEVSSFADGEALDVPGQPRVAHAPGHTPGSAALVLERRRVAFTGDSLVTWNPLTGRGGPQIMPSGLNHDTDQALGSLDVVASLPADVLLPGHGDPWSEGASEATRLARSAGRS
jgi:glyoxylase-like metal-dependent hydrolase (beta-lactamase superfamily II)